MTKALVRLQIDALSKPGLLIAIRAIIEYARVQKQFVNYIDLAQVTGTFSGGSELAQLLGIIAKDDHDNARPISTALVVRKDSGIPGAGFFSMLAALGHNVGTADAEKNAFWSKQVTLLHGSSSTTAP